MPSKSHTAVHCSECTLDLDRVGHADECPRGPLAAVARELTRRGHADTPPLMSSRPTLRPWPPAPDPVADAVAAYMDAGTPTVGRDIARKVIVGSGRAAVPMILTYLGLAWECGDVRARANSLISEIADDMIGERAADDWLPVARV